MKTERENSNHHRRNFSLVGRAPPMNLYVALDPSGIIQRTDIAANRLPFDFVCAAKNLHIVPTQYIVTVDVTAQTMRLYSKAKLQSRTACFPQYELKKRYLISTSRYGTGQSAKSNQTPLGLHRVARKIGAGWPTGTAFQSREPVGKIWAGLPNAPIAHRILWLEGLEPGFNQGGNVDSFNRYIYIHGCGNEITLGRPASRGCIHLAACDLLPLFELLPIGTLVGIGRR
jgi:hypothetical protein